VTAGGADSTVTVDQSAVDGWQSLGDFAFAAEGNQHVHLGDNTGEPSANNLQLVFDAVRITNLDSNVGSDWSSDGGGSGSNRNAMTGGGCNVGGSAGLLVVAIPALAARRRRSRVASGASPIRA